MSQEDQIRWNHQNSRENETDHFEKSSLTEEHGHSIGSGNICYSSDGSLNSNKRQKCSSPPNGRLNSGEWVSVPLLTWRGHVFVGFVSFKLALILSSNCYHKL